MSEEDVRESLKVEDIRGRRQRKMSKEDVRESLKVEDVRRDVRGRCLRRTLERALKWKTSEETEEDA